MQLSALVFALALLCVCAHSHPATRKLQRLKADIDTLVASAHPPLLISSAMTFVSQHAMVSDDPNNIQQQESACASSARPMGDATVNSVVMFDVSEYNAGVSELQVGVEHLGYADVPGSGARNYRTTQDHYLVDCATDEFGRSDSYHRTGTRFCRVGLRTYQGHSTPETHLANEHSVCRDMAVHVTAGSAFAAHHVRFTQRPATLQSQQSACASVAHLDPDTTHVHVILMYERESNGKPRSFDIDVRHEVAAGSPNYNANRFISAKQFFVVECTRGVDGFSRTREQKCHVALETDKGDVTYVHTRSVCVSV